MSLFLLLAYHLLLFMSLFFFLVPFPFVLFAHIPFMSIHRLITSFAVIFHFYDRILAVAYIFHPSLPQFLFAFVGNGNNGSFANFQYLATKNIAMNIWISVKSSFFSISVSIWEFRSREVPWESMRATYSKINVTQICHSHRIILIETWWYIYGTIGHEKWLSFTNCVLSNSEMTSLKGK